jgi:VIT1/CCC1 family predicted Fe2+/Mn2+ transporter
MAPQLGLVAPLSYEEQKKAEIEATHQAEINRQAEIEARRQAELEAYRLAEIERRRQAELEAYHQAEVEAEIKTQKKSQSRLLQILWISVGIAFGGAVVITILGGILANVPGLSYNLIFAGLILFAIGVFWTIGGTIFWGENQIYFRLSQDRSRSLRFQLSRIGIFIWCIASVIGLISIAIGSSTLQGCPATAVSNATCPSGIGAWVSDISFGVLSFSCLGIIAAFIFFVLTLVVGRRR